MAMFPASLPGPLIGTLKIGGVDPWVSDPSEVGSDARRKRFTRSLETFAFTLRLSDAQLATLKTFYKTTLSDGVDSFTWTNPQDSVAYTVRFDGRPGESNVSFDVWDVSVALTEV